MDPDLKLHPTFVFYKNYRSLLINIGIYFYFYLSRSRISKEKCSGRLFKYTKSPRVVAGAGQYLEHQKSSVPPEILYIIHFFSFCFRSERGEATRTGPQQQQQPAATCPPNRRRLVRNCTYRYTPYQPAREEELSLTSEWAPRQLWWTAHRRFPNCSTAPLPPLPTTITPVGILWPDWADRKRDCPSPCLCRMQVSSHHFLKVEKLYF